MRYRFFLFSAFFLIGITVFSQKTLAFSSGDIIINEIAWMGTKGGSTEEWMELYNRTSQSISLDGWYLKAQDGSPNIELNGIITSNSYFLLERTDDEVISDIDADMIYTGALENRGEILLLKNGSGALLDQVSMWFAGDKALRCSMERKKMDIWNTGAENWATNDGITVNGKDKNGGNICGTPKKENSAENINPPPPSSYSVILNEIMWMGTNKSSSDEWIELKNISEETVNLFEYRLTRLVNGEEREMITFPEIFIEPDSFLLIARKNTSESALHIKADLIDTSLVLNNTKLKLKLYNKENELIDEADDGSGYPLSGSCRFDSKQGSCASGAPRKSMSRKEILMNGALPGSWYTEKISNNFKADSIDRGTPGAKNGVEDIDSPQKINDLSLMKTTEDSLQIRFSAPLDSDIYMYDIRYSILEITEDNFFDIENREQDFFVKPGEIITKSIVNLAPDTFYNLAVKTSDEKGNFSIISCILKATTSKKKHIVINELAFRNENDFIELACLTCTESGMDISGYILNDQKIATGTLIYNYLSFDLNLPDTNAEIVLYNKEKELIDSLSYGSGTTLDYDVLLSGIEVCENYSFSVGRIESANKEHLYFDDSYALFFIHTRNARNQHINQSPFISLGLRDQKYIKLNEDYKYQIGFFEPESCDPDGDTLEFFWDFGDGHTSTEKNVKTHTYDDIEKYALSVSAYDSYYGSGIDLTTIHFEDPKTLKIFINELDYNEDWVEIYCEYCFTNGVSLSNFKLTKNENVSTYYQFPEGIMIKTGDYAVVEFRKEKNMFIGENMGYIHIFSKKSGLASKGKLNLMFSSFPEYLDSKEWVSQSNNGLFSSYIRAENNQFLWTSKATKGENNIFLQSGNSNENNTAEDISSLSELSDKIFINELYVNPKGKDAEKEFIEIFNNGNREVNLINWILDDIEDGGSSPYKISDSLKILSQGYQLFYSKDTKITLNNSGDCVRLIDPLGTEVSKVCYEDSKEDFSYARKPDGTYRWVKIVTPNTTNDFELPPPPNCARSVLIYEVLANPEGKDDKEYIALINMDTDTINLKGWSIDNREGGSSPFFIHNNLFLKPNETKKFLKEETKLILRNSFDQARLFNEEGVLIDLVSWENAKEGEIVRPEKKDDKDSADVIRVIDGDTLEVMLFGKKETVRLIGIDTPETVHPTKEVEHFGKEASAYTREKLLGKTVILTYEEERHDKYNRILAYVYVDNRFFNAELLMNGYAYVYPYFPFSFYEQFLWYEQMAKNEGRGLWGDNVVRKTIEEKLEELRKEEDVLTESGITLSGTTVSDIISFSYTSSSYTVSGSGFLRINEIYASPNKTEEEWIEIRNMSSSGVNLKGWGIDDIIEGGSKKHIFKDDFIILKGEYKLLNQATTKIYLNNGGDSVYLYDPYGNIVDEVHFGKHNKGQSYIFQENTWKWSDLTTPARANQLYVLTGDTKDSDKDTLTDEIEIILYKTNPYKSDTDNDGINDGLEILLNFDPRVFTQLQSQDLHSLKTFFEKKTVIHKPRIYSKKGIFLKGRTFPYSKIKLTLNGPKQASIFLRTDEKGYFSYAYKRAFPKGNYYISVEMFMNDSITLRKRNIRMLNLDEMYIPYHKKLQFKKYKIKKLIEKIKYRFRNIFFDESNYLSGTIKNVYIDQNHFLLETKEEVTTIYFEEKDISDYVYSILFQKGIHVKVRVRAKNNKYFLQEIYFYESVKKGLSNIIPKNREIIICLIIIAFFSVWMIKEMRSCEA